MIASVARIAFTKKSGSKLSYHSVIDHFLSA